MFDRGIDRRRLFQLWVAVFGVNILLESPGIIADVYTYYGKQPLNIWGFPLWWGFINPLMPMIAGAMIFKLKPHLQNQWALAGMVIASVPMADGIANAACGWPVITALNTDVGYAGTWIAAFITLGLCAMVVWIIGLLVAHPATAAASEPARTTTTTPVQPAIPVGV